MVEIKYTDVPVKKTPAQIMTRILSMTGAVIIVAGVGMVLGDMVKHSMVDSIQVAASGIGLLLIATGANEIYNKNKDA
jgi:hypothetical protein